MSRGHNTIKRSEVSTTPALLKYSTAYESSSLSSYGITINRGVNTSYSQSAGEFLNFALVRQLYYQEYLTGSLNFSASFWNDSLQSTAASGTFDNDYRYFPTGAGDKITVIAIPHNIFGEQISRKSLNFSSSAFNLVDDGNGNIVDTMASNTHVGNVLYNQGIAILTNQDYAFALIPADCDISGTALRSFADNPFIGDGCITGSIYLMTPSNPPTSQLLTRAQLASLTPVISDFNTGNFAIPNTPYTVGFPGYPDLTAWFQIKYDGYIDIPETGTFNFRMCSDDGSIFRLYDLSNNLVYTLNHDGQHGYTCANSNVSLTSGVYRFEMDYYQGPPIFLGLTLYWTRPGDTEEIIPEEYFVCSAPTTTTTTTSTTTSTTTEQPTTTSTTSTTTTNNLPTTTSTTSTTTTNNLPTTTSTTSTTTSAPTTTTTTSTTTSTTTLGYRAFLLAYSATSGEEACTRYPTVFTNTYYTNPAFSVLSNGVIIYQDQALTSPAGNGFYSNGTNYWNTGAGSGNLQNQTACPGATTTSTTTSTTTAAPTTTSTTTSTTTAAPTTTSTTTSTTTTYSCTPYDYTYTTVPNDLYVRYSDCTTNTILTVLVDTLPTMDNGNGTFTATICVRNGSSYSVPVCVQNLLEIVCPNGNTWVAGENC